MKINNVFLCIILVSIFAMATNAKAEREGHGGAGLKINGRIYVLDLVEAGVTKNPYFDTTVTPDPLIVARLKQVMVDPKFPITKLAQKLSEIALVDKLFSHVILKTLEHYQWKFVDQSLIPIGDEESPLGYSPNSLVQLASRLNRSIFIDEELWTLLDEANQVALLFHEALYAVIEPETGAWTRDPLTGQYNSNKFQSSPKAREMTGYLFSERYRLAGFEGLRSLAESNFTVGFGKTRVWDESSNVFVSTDPYLSIEVNAPEWQAQNSLLSLDVPASEIIKRSSRACEIAVKNKLAIQIKTVDDSYSFGASTYKSAQGRSSYFRFDHFGSGTSFIIFAKTFPDVQACKDSLVTVIQTEIASELTRYN